MHIGVRLILFCNLSDCIKYVRVCFELQPVYPSHQPKLDRPSSHVNNLGPECLKSQIKLS